MKRILSILLIALTLASLAACSGKPSPSEEPESYKTLLDNAVQLYNDGFSREQLDKVCHPNETEYKIAAFRERRDSDYIEALQNDIESFRRTYDELYGDDWKISYTVREAVEKDEAGIEQYKNYDNYYFEEYGIDTGKFQAVTFAKITVHIEGSKGSFDKDKTIQCFCIDGKWYSLYAIMIGYSLAPKNNG